MLDGPALAGAQEAGVGFLHDVVDVGGADQAVQIGAEGGLVRGELDCEPLRRIGLGRIHGARNAEVVGEIKAAIGVPGWRMGDAT